MQNGFKALNDETRRSIIKLLKEGDMTAGEIASHFDISKPSISHHLDILKQAELVSVRRAGQHLHYALNMTVVEDLLGWFLSLTQNIDKDEKR